MEASDSDFTVRPIGDFSSINEPVSVIFRGFLLALGLHSSDEPDRRLQ